MRDFTAATLKWLADFPQKHHFEFTEINNTQKINAKYLKDYKLFIQLDFPPYMWSDESKAAFTDYIEKGKGGDYRIPFLSHSGFKESQHGYG